MKCLGILPQGFWASATKTKLLDFHGILDMMSFTHNVHTHVIETLEATKSIEHIDVSITVLPTNNIMSYLEKPPLNEEMTLNATASNRFQQLFSSHGA